MRCFNRLTVIGTKQRVKAFQRSSWITQLNAKFIEPLEFSERRFVCQFETTGVPTEQMKTLSVGHPGLTLLLDFELPVSRIKGVAKAKTGEVIEHRIKY